MSLKIYKKKFSERNYNFNEDELINLDKENRNLINKKELLEKDKKTLSKSKEKSNFEKSKNLTQEIIKISEKQKIIQQKLSSRHRSFGIGRYFV